MIERSGCLRFLHKPPHPLLIRRKLCRQNLQRDFAIESRVARTIDLAHATRAEFGNDAVMRKSCIGEKFVAQG